MTPTHYHMNFDFHAVTLYEQGRVTWTSDGLKASSVNVKPLDELVGRQVERGGHLGVVKEFLSARNDVMDGKYLPHSQRYATGRGFYNQQVGVYWHTVNPQNGLAPYWNHFNSLTFLS